MEPLTEREVNEILTELTDEQKEYLNVHIKRSKKSKWLEVLTLKKGVTLAEGMSEDEVEEELDSWVLKEILDGGFGNKPYRCECGNPLRYQYIVLHTKEKKVYKLGVTCLENYTNLSAEIISDIKKGFHTIDLERDELLTKFRNRRFFSLEPFRYIENLPKDMVKQVDVGLPLTDRQIEHLYHLKSVYDKEVHYQRVYKGFNEEQRRVFDELPRWKRQEVIQKIIEDGPKLSNIPDGFYNKEIETFIELDLPLLDSHLVKLSEFNKQSRLEKMLMQQARESRINSMISNITYEELIHRHIETLKRVREKEMDIPRGLKQDWDKIQENVRHLKAGEEIDYSSLKLNLNNLLYALKIKPDAYL